MSRRTADADARTSPARDGLASLASVTLARLYLEQRQPDRARAMLRAVLVRNPLDVAARALARRVGPPAPRLSLGIEPHAWIVRGEVPLQLASYERLEIVLAIFRAEAASSDDGRSIPSTHVGSTEPEWIVRTVVFEGLDLGEDPADGLLARDDMVPFEVRVDPVEVMGRASIAACLRRASSTVGPAATDAASVASTPRSPTLSNPRSIPPSTSTARIIAVAAVQHL